jgi:hypothetical protein
MSETSTSNNFKNNDFNSNTDKSDYISLNIRLEEIKNTITLLEKKISK